MACVKAKRRCDQRSPECARCAQRKIPCEYHHPPSQATRARTRLEPLADPTAPSAPERTLQVVAVDGPHRERDIGQDVRRMAVGDDADVGFFEGPWDGSTHGPPLHLDPWLQDGPLGSVDGGPTPSVRPMDTSGWTTTLEHLDLLGDDAFRSCFSADAPLVREPSLPMHVPGTRPHPLQLSSPTGFDVEDISKILENKMSYAVGKIKSAPKQMLLELQTPWCHASLYKDVMPPVMQGM